MSLPKCYECLGCMHPVWVDNNRYFYCDLCRLYYAGQNVNLYVVDNPYYIECPNCKVASDFCDLCSGTKKVDRRLYAPAE